MTNYPSYMLEISGQTFRERCQSICDSLHYGDQRYDWVGIYWLEGDTLILGPWAGRQATEHTRIPVAEGICGAAAREKTTVIVEDVRSDPRYLSCFLETRSEIVVPIFSQRRIIGEIDIDSSDVGAFGRRDRVFLELLASSIGKEWPGQW